MAGFRDRLREVIRRAGGQRALAERSGVAKRTIAKYVGGESEPSLQRLVALAQAGGVSVEWLATGDAPAAAGDAACAARGALPVREPDDASAASSAPGEPEAGEHFGAIARELASAIEEVGYQPGAMTREGLKTVMYSYGLPRAGVVVLLQFLAASDERREPPRPAD